MKITLSRDIVASTITRAGSTRVIEMDVVVTSSSPFEIPRGVFTAYDSNQPGESLHMGVTDFTGDLDAMRNFALDLLIGDDTECTCWAGWDVQCGRPNCWGIFTPAN